ncbi:MAG: High-affinity branched-chain amino acid transport ATP-binding protein LivF [Alphaproteobacteria bacterium MarineAlpha9_Bin6]|mgnify:FL=1|nr:MAG: High-affinity branched-chain amino acid transport ATP-binding protein LivF [Alphaproteobacteria bacterium MarineAlpha9_Bin6]
MLRLENVHSFYGRIQALRGINLHVDSGEIVAMIGANGAGKSTTLMTICGQPRARSGRVLFDGDDITHVPTFQIIRSGLSHSPEGRRIFPRMTVLENLQMGAVASDPAHFNDDLGLVFDLFPILGERQQQRGGTLSGGEQQMLAIARALMSHPRLLLLDEPSLGLGPMLVKQIFDVIGQINQDRGVTILLVEQNAHQSLLLAHRAYVLANGEIILHGTGDELLADPEVRNAYLGGGN